ncbi:hypothetical protein [Ammoniphilus sp. YIM 78166]|nr:hypothetical protein [Ammoniphilus sp. YIM 78166]
MKDPKETYVVYKQENGEPPQEEIRSTEELTSDEYYEYIEDDRIIPEEE